MLVVIFFIVINLQHRLPCHNNCRTIPVGRIVAALLEVKPALAFVFISNRRNCIVTVL